MPNLKLVKNHSKRLLSTFYFYLIIKPILLLIQLFCKHTFSLKNRMRSYPVNREFDMALCSTCYKQLGTFKAIEGMRVSGMIVDDNGQVLGSIQRYKDKPNA
jgi:hypothetical protein